MIKNNFQKTDNYVDQVSIDVNVAGDKSVRSFGKFREYIGHLFVLITIASLAMLFSEFVRMFDVAPWTFSTDAQIDFFIFHLEAGEHKIFFEYLAIMIALPLSYMLARFGEDAKIDAIRSVVNAQTNKIWFGAAAIVVIAVLLFINAKGVQAIADASLRYMNTELQEGVVFQLKKEKLDNHANLAKTDTASTISNTAVTNLMSSRASIIATKQQEIAAAKSAHTAKTAKYQKSSYTYRTFLSNQQTALAKKIAKIAKKYSKRIADMDWKIQKAEGKVNARRAEANKMRQSELEKADEATEEVVNYYNTESGKNAETIEEYRHYGLYFALLGEIIDGGLAFIFFMMARTNPNLNGKLEVQENTRQIIKMEDFDTSDAKIIKRGSGTPFSSRLNTTKKESRQSTQAPMEQVETHAREAYDAKGFYAHVAKVARRIAEQDDKHVTLEEGSYLKHPSQKRLREEMKMLGISLTPKQSGIYLDTVADELLFVNQKVGFVYAEKAGVLS